MCRDGRFTIPTALLISSAIICFFSSILLTYAVFSASFRTFDDERFRHSFGLIRYCKVPIHSSQIPVQCFSREIRQKGIEPPSNHLLIAQSELIVLIVLVLAMHFGLLSSVASLLALCSKMCAKLSRILLMLSGSFTFLGAILFSHFSHSSPLNSASFLNDQVQYKFGMAFGWCLVAGSGFSLALILSIVSTLIDDEVDLLETTPLRRASTIKTLKVTENPAFINSFAFF
ncbi:unnamed protein product, partial [Mesorhabditis belari]|uniref:Uncharacterized protein n=1 Tax=Mesorhabditis belari TaxID=2138241 RepID=A0AAF3EDN6_9BILA